jgi:selenide,water dikinase
VVRGLTKAAPRDPVAELLVGLDDGDDAAVVRLEGGMALIATTDFFTPVVDDAYDWGRIAATNALSDVYAMGGRPVVAMNLLAWPRDVLPLELAAETLRGGLDVCSDAGCHLAGGHSVDDPEPKYGLAVTGIADPNRLLRNDAGKPGNALSLTKPLGIGVLNSRHKATGERFPEAIEIDDDAQRRSVYRRARGGHRMCHGHNRFRTSRTSVQIGAGQRRHGGDRLNGCPLPGRRS